MNNSNIDTQLEYIVNNLNKVEGVDGSLIADSDGSVLSHKMPTDADVFLFGPMAHVITSSSERLLNSAQQGKIERVLIESKDGKALFLHSGNIYFVVLMKTSANVGLVMISSKRAVQEIVKLTKDLIPKTKIVEELAEPEHKVQTTAEEIKITPQTQPEKPAEAESMVKSSEAEMEVNEVQAEIVIPAEDSVVQEQIKEKSEKVVTQPEIEIPPVEEVGVEEVEKVVEEHIPVIKPPISFPELPEDVKIPEGDEERSDLVLDIYESIFLAMSIGASKIMGVSPARGFLKQFLPFEECKKLLEGVGVKNNAVVDFDKIRNNVQSIPLNERQETLINDFSKIIDIITENYGKVMGYGAFRGMVRSEFKVINDSFGRAMEELGIKNKIHPKLINLFQ